MEKLEENLENKAVFLDRDGTIIIDHIYLNDPNRIDVFEESYPALELLHQKGYLIFIVTNQSGVARGFVQEENVKKINEIIIADFKEKKSLITAAYYCPHHVDGGCICRKPNPGMLQLAAQTYNVDLKKSWMVGDRMSDVEAGRRGGARGILLQNKTTPPIDNLYDKPEFICSDVLEAAKLIIKNDNV
jgi:D-glycero-D-manno-heptose 1,7-bisphosphate phosphatase